MKIRKRSGRAKRKVSRSGRIGTIISLWPREGDYEAADRIPRAHKNRWMLTSQRPLRAPRRLVSIDSISLFDHFGERIMNLLKIFKFITLNY